MKRRIFFKKILLNFLGIFIFNFSTKDSFFHLLLAKNRTTRDQQKSSLSKSINSVHQKVFSTTYNILIQNGLVFSNHQLIQTDIAIDSKGYLFFLPTFKRKNNLKAKTKIDAKNKIVSSGFVDILAENNVPDSAKTLAIFEQYKIRDGVTTALEMHGGTTDFTHYKQKNKSLSHCINYGASTMLMGIRQKYPYQKDRRQAIISCLKAGALGISHSIEYQPLPYEELLEYAKIAYRYDVPLFLHLRYSDKEKELLGVKEAIQLAFASQAHVHIDHLNSTGGCFNMQSALDIIEEAIQKGAKMTICVYPYSFWATYLHSTRFSTGWQNKYGFSYEDLTIVGTGEKLTKESFDRYRKQYGILVASPHTAMPLEDTFDLAIKKKFCLIGSDGGIKWSKKSNSHPRGAGCFAKSIKRMQTLGMDMNDILYKLTILPTRVIKSLEGNADLRPSLKDPNIVVFDPQKIDNFADIINPNQYSVGIDSVIVNGNISLKNNKIIKYKGKIVVSELNT